MKFILIFLVLITTFYAGINNKRDVQRNTTDELTTIARQIEVEEREAKLRAIFQSKVSRVQRYLLSKGSPLADSAEDLVVCSESNGFHFAFLVGIANAESSLGKHYTLSNNVWNWNVHNGRTFPSISVGACHIAKSIRANYDTTSTLAIAEKYAPKSDGNNPVSWSRTVEMTMGEIESL